MARNIRRKSIINAELTAENKSLKQELKNIRHELIAYEEIHEDSKIKLQKMYQNNKRMFEYIGYLKKVIMFEFRLKK